VIDLVVDSVTSTHIRVILGGQGVRTPLFEVGDGSPTLGVYQVRNFAFKTSKCRNAEYKLQTHRRNFMEVQGGSDPHFLKWGWTLHLSLIKSEILPSKRLMQKYRVQTAL